MFTYLTIGGDFITGLTATVSNMFTDVTLLLVLVIGLPLAFWVIRKIVGLAHAR